MRFEKFIPQSFDAPLPTLMRGPAGKPLVPPSLVPEKPRAIPAPPPPPMFTEEQMKEAEQNGYRRGFLEGEKEGRTQAEAAQSKITEALGQAVEKLAGELHTLIEAHNQFATEKRAEVPKLALAIARKVAGQALEANALATVEVIATSCIERLLPTPHIVITVAETLAPALEEYLITHFAHNQDPGEITIQGDAALGSGDCRIVWEHGSAVRDTASLWREIETLIYETQPPSNPTQGV